MALLAWIAEGDQSINAEWGYTVPSKNGTTVDLVRLGALGPQARGLNAKGKYDAETILTIVRERIKERLQMRRKFPEHTTLEEEFEVPMNAFHGCRTVDDFIAVLITAHAAPASSKIASLLNLSPGREPPAVFDD